jgi:hypothetical protein
VSDPQLSVLESEQLRDEQIAALSQTYPAWQIRYVAAITGPLRWWATRHAPLSTAQSAAGLVPCIARYDVDALTIELAVQDEIVHTMER